MALCVRRLRGAPGLTGRRSRSGERAAGGGAARAREPAHCDIGWHPVLCCPRLSTPLRRPVPPVTANQFPRARPCSARLTPPSPGGDQTQRRLEESLPPSPAPGTVGDSWHLSGTQLDCFRSLFEPGVCRTPYQALALPAPGTYQGVLAFHPSASTGATPSPGGNQPDLEQQLAIMHAKLREELPKFFSKSPDYSVYRRDVEFVNSILHLRTRGLIVYQLLMTLSRLVFLSYYSDARVSVLKLTSHPETGSIQARWSVSGLPLHSLLFHFYRSDKSELYRTYDAHSTFYLAADGLISLHKMERVMPSAPLQLPKKTLLAAALVALGMGENRPALNLLSAPKAANKLRSPILP